MAEYNVIKSFQNYFEEYNILGEGVGQDRTNGLYIAPSQVPGRLDITDYILRAVDNNGKVEWAENSILTLTLGELQDVNITLPSTSTLVYNSGTWENNNVTPILEGDAIDLTLGTINVLYDGSSLNTLSNILQVEQLSNAKLVNSSFTLTQTGGLTLTSPAVLGGNVNIGIDTTVITTAGGQEINGTLTLDQLNITSDFSLFADPSTTSFTLILPLVQGAIGQFLKNNGSGTLNWDSFVTKAQLTWKDSVRASTTTPGTLASDFENGDTLDGIVLATGDRILVKDQASGVENGIYTVNASGAPTRASDLEAGNTADGAAVFIQEGTQNGDTGWSQNSVGTTVGTDPLTWVQIITLTPPVPGGVVNEIQLSDGNGNYVAASLSTFNYTDNAATPTLGVSENFSLEGQAGTGVGAGSNVSLTAGNGGTTGAGSGVGITTGAGGSTSGNSGDLALSSGTATSGTTGDINVNTSQGLNSGSITLQAGSATNGTGGGVNILAGDSEATVEGGDINLTPGTASGETLLEGRVNINSALQQDSNSTKTGGSIATPELTKNTSTDGTYIFGSAGSGSSKFTIYDITANITQTYSNNSFFPGTLTTRQAISGRNLWVCGLGQERLYCVDVSNTGQPSVITDIALVDIRSITTHGNFIYIGGDNFISAYDISDNTTPLLVSTLSSSARYTNTQDMEVSENALYSCSQADDLIALHDITKPNDLTFIQSRQDSLLDAAKICTVDRKYLYVVAAGNDNISTWETTPTSISTNIDSLVLENNIIAMAYNKNKTYVTVGGSGDALYTVDTRDPTNLGPSENIFLEDPFFPIVVGNKVVSSGDNMTESLIPQAKLNSSNVGNILTYELLTYQITFLESVDFRQSMVISKALVDDLVLYKGEVTQATSTTTAVTLNSTSGRITMFSNSMAGNSDLTFTVNSTYSLANSVILTNVISFDGTAFPHVYVNSRTNSSFDIVLENLSSSAMSNNNLTLGFVIL